MATMSSKSGQLPAKMADYFFICGVDSDALRWEDDLAQPLQTKGSRASFATPIKEERAKESQVDVKPDTVASAISPPRSSKRSSFQRLTRTGDDKRWSIASRTTTGSGNNHIDGLSKASRGTESNRSSATVRAIQVNGTGPLTEADFEHALLKFAAERDSFLTDLSLNAGAVVKAQHRQRARPQRVLSDDGKEGGSIAAALKPGLGSIRRRISFREMGNSIKRQSSIARNASVRTSRRMSNYNAVIPDPQPLDADPEMHPLKRKLLPSLLDRYPSRLDAEQLKHRVPFPDYVPMFAFPNDIHVVSSDERPRSTWHGFALTSADNSRVYGVCITVWMPVNPQASAALERRCDDWRKKHMTDEERELASSLGERLATERAKLSRLLAQLPSVISGSPAREELEDEISAVEEKIALMADLLRPVRHGAASKIDGLTNGETGLWVPRAYGILGRDLGLTSFWKEWLRAMVVPMTNGAVLRVPASSPRVGMWQPLERYVINLCAEAMPPLSSKTQVEISLRDLHLYARKEAINELPGAHNTDLYPLFRALSIPQIVVLLEYILNESRIILISSHTAMLHLASRSLIDLLYPLQWAGVFIPVLPARLLQALEAPCPYIVGIERRYENIDFPAEDYVVVDLDANEIESTSPPISLPKQQRRKLLSLLHLAAPHHSRYGVPLGPPAYAIESFPWDAFACENGALFQSNPAPSSLAKFVSLPSQSFGENQSSSSHRPPLLNAFVPGRDSRSTERPGTTATTRDSPPSLSPSSQHFPLIVPPTRHESGTTLQASLREKRSGYFEGLSRRSSSFTMERRPAIRRPSVPFMPGHSSSPSLSSNTTDDGPLSTYAPSVIAPSSYAQSTVAASTILPQISHHSVQNSETVFWIEGHCLHLQPSGERLACLVCTEKSEEALYCCTGCNMHAHQRCASQIGLVCTASFQPEQIRAAFVRCFASLFYTYRKHLHPTAGDARQAGARFRFNSSAFIKSMPRETAAYLEMLQSTQAFNEFVHEREMKSADDPDIVLFDQIILAKRNRGRASLLGRAKTPFLSDRSDHLWRTATATPPNSRFPGDYRQVITRMPAKLDPAFMKEPRVLQGVPRPLPTKARRKPIPSMLGLQGAVASTPAV